MSKTPILDSLKEMVAAFAPTFKSELQMTQFQLAALQTAREEIKEHRRMIAAAPKLLEALEAAVNSDTVRDALKKVGKLDKARSAIKSATEDNLK